MNKNEISICLEIINAIDNDWALTDDCDKHEHMFLVDSNRTKREDLKPMKSLIKKMEKEGLIKTEDVYEEREYMKLLGKSYAVPFVYMYKVTEKGLGFKKKYK